MRKRSKNFSRPKRETNNSIIPPYPCFCQGDTSIWRSTSVIPSQKKPFTLSDNGLYPSIESSFENTWGLPMRRDPTEFQILPRKGSLGKDLEKASVNSPPTPANPPLDRQRDCCVVNTCAGRFGSVRLGCVCVCVFVCM